MIPAEVIFVKIREVSRITGLSKKTIRFYESSNLFFPEKKNKNGMFYREYSENDVIELQKIIALRQSKFSIEEIRQTQNSPEKIIEVFRNYRSRLQLEHLELTAILEIVNNIPDEFLLDKEAVYNLLLNGPYDCRERETICKRLSLYYEKGW